MAFESLGPKVSLTKLCMKLKNLSVALRNEAGSKNC